MQPTRTHTNTNINVYKDLNVKQFVKNVSSVKKVKLARPEGDTQEINPKN